MATPNIVPRADSEGGIGTASKYWGSAYIDLIYVGAGKIGRDADNLFDFSVDNEITFRVNATDEMVLNDSSLSPHANRGLSLGTSALRWKDLHLGDAAVINFNNHNVTLTHSDNALTLADGDYMQFGSSGDLQIYHSGASSAVNNTTGHLYISNGADDSDIIFQCDDGSGGVETYFMLDGSFGVTKFPDNKKLVFGNGLDVQVYHDGTNSYFYNQGGDLYIQNATDNKDIIFQSDDGSGSLTDYFRLDGSLTATKFSQNAFFIDGKKMMFGSSLDLQIYHDATDSIIDNATGDLVIRNNANDKDIKFQCDNGDSNLDTYFYLDGSSATHDGSATTALYTNWPDKSRISVGTGHDLRIYHDGTQSLIDNMTGDLYIRNFADDGDIIFQSDDGSGGATAYLTLDGGATAIVADKSIYMADNKRFYAGGGGDLGIYHDGSNSFIDNSTGIFRITQSVVDGDLVLRADNGSGSPTPYLTLDGGNTRTNVHKDLRFDDNIGTVFGSGAALKLFSDGSNGIIDNFQGSLLIRQQVDDASITFQSDNGAGGIATYFKIDGGTSTHDGSATTALYTNWPDKSRISMGDSHDLQIFHDSNNSNIENNVGALFITNRQDDGDIIFKSDDGSGGVATYLTLDGGDVSTIVNTIKVLMPNLPTSDPGTTGQLWNDNGTLKISAGG